MTPTALVPGGAGFVGSHLCERLLAEGWEVICLDSLLTGSEQNLAPLIGRDGFRFQLHDVTTPIDLVEDIDWILQLASPASPTDYMKYPIETLRVGALGTFNLLDLARSKGAGLLLMSTSEVYGDPKVHPQPESYWGNVNPVGPRAVYDEAKRYAEALTVAYHRVNGIPVRIARVFNTFGPRMRGNDGRAVPTFIDQALHGGPLTVHGDGGQTRSLCYVDDLVEGLWRLLLSDVTTPVNLGNPNELTVLDLARLVCELAEGSCEIAFVERPTDDPQFRCPDISLARDRLGWEPKTDLKEGLAMTISWARQAWI